MTTIPTRTKKCTHENMEMIEPCCSVMESRLNGCVCHGRNKAFCPDCWNTKLTNSQARAFIAAQIEGQL